MSILVMGVLLGDGSVDEGFDIWQGHSTVSQQQHKTRR